MSDPGDDDRGHVTPGSAPWRLDLAGATVHKLSVSEMDNNVYLLTCTATGERLLVDAADDADRILDLLRSTSADGSTTLGQLVTTHQHWDHHRALPEVVAATGATTLAGADDADALPVPADRRLEDGDTVRVGDLVLDVVGLRGHTPGSVALALTAGGDVPRTVLFTGDSLFPGGPGRTRAPEDFTSLMDDLEARVFGVYDDTALVLPGHGDNTVLGRERPQLGSWRARGW
ncbi:MBL fold metallo-hydrolase [Ornithinimicrobium humiphilum]|uniref:Glyoxylase-like metal-dependent hydrolase (Beta-lactamase superfamily II) n=1 Tax=Ornithinimicrobium humiphilum TaxID=125288 RepID=A0A543KPH5_9MICO|nr:MBL fold metallo-hydrolase [Ornithinimicrobium humiphilum]TQM96978.1 glyoxylase-like metal-dependent hydrolase (beta-lactamase superfamily II) [Ornithinimicrobium humiphilum]